MATSHLHRASNPDGWLPVRCAGWRPHERQTPAVTGGVHQGALRPVKFSRLSKRGILLGLTLPQLIAIGIAIASFVIGLYLGGPWTLYTASLWLPALLVAVVPIGGRSIVEWLPVALAWVWRSLTGQTRYRRRITRPRPAGTLALPGDTAALRQYVDPETGAVMVHDPHAQTLTVLREVSHPSSSCSTRASRNGVCRHGGGCSPPAAGPGGSPACRRSSSAPSPTPAPGCALVGHPGRQRRLPGSQPPTKSSSNAPAPPGNGTSRPCRSAMKAASGRSAPPAVGCAAPPRCCGRRWRRSPRRCGPRTWTPPTGTGRASWRSCCAPLTTPRSHPPWTGPGTSARISPPQAPSRSRKPGTGSAQTPPGMPCCGSANGPAAWCSPASCRR